MTSSIDQDENNRIQGYRFDIFGPKLPTEVARTISNHLGWHFDADDHVVEGPDGPVIGMTIEDVTAAMMENSWIDPSNASRGGYVPYWNRIPDDPKQAAEQLRQKLDEDGCHQNWRAKMRKKN